jgi:hypothetical protein
MQTQGPDNIGEITIRPHDDDADASDADNVMKKAIGGEAQQSASST